MKSKIFLVVFLLMSLSIYAQTFTDSNLPIVIITTDNDPNTGQPIEIPDDPKVLGTMKIIFRPDGSRNYLTDQNTAAYLNYNGRIGIELRGSSSQALPKKPYGLTTLKNDNINNNNVVILGMPKENDWVLNSLAFDPSLMRDYLSYELARNIGSYSARGQYCEVVINGDYKGLYVFMEKLKIDAERINILKLTTSDNSSPAVTGGYVTKCDKTTGGDPVAWTFSSYSGGNVDFIHENPKPDDITTSQNTYIFNYFNAFKNSITAQNGSIVDGYPTLIDVPNFIDFMILNEIASNVDAYQYSTFFHKDRNGKLRAGPIWDLNLTYGNDLFQWGFDRSHTDVWQFDNGDNTGAKFWKDLYNNSTYKCYLAKRWNELNASGEPLSYNAITSRIDEIASLLSESMAREQQRWGTVGNHANHISEFKLWLQERITWLNTNLSNYQSCSNPTIPPLVISKIHYNPVTVGGSTSDNLEFIGITNNSNATINLTGLYLRELGVTYQFPVNSSIEANAEILISSNTSTFTQFYGFAPFGQFTRNLSNKSHKLHLSDAFGNTIDYVEYFDTAPWPTAADGEGLYLQLTDLNSDNNLGSNWMASSQTLSINYNSFESSISIHPNPAFTSISVESIMPMKSYEIFDPIGRKVMFGNPNRALSTEVNISKLAPNAYYLKVVFENGNSAVRKVVKL